VTKWPLKKDAVRLAHTASLAAAISVRFDVSEAAGAVLQGPHAREEMRQDCRDVKAARTTAMQIGRSSY
jgi:hypothetical protein